MKAGAAQRRKSRSQARFAVLSQVKTPLAFFGLLLLTAEGSFGFCLARYSYTEAVTKLFANWMGALFLVGTLAVLILTKIAPNQLLGRSQDNTLIDPEIQMRRIREAARLIFQFSELKTKTPERILDLLDQVENTLTGLADKKAVPDSSIQ